MNDPSRPSHRVWWRRAGYGLGRALRVYVLVCVALFLLQDFFLYHPVGLRADVPSFVMTRGDARIVVSTQAARDAASPQAVLYFGGNGEDVSASLERLGSAFPGIAVYAMHYRGYGGSSGRPREATLVADATALFDTVAKQHPRIVLVGRSLGSGIALQVAARRRAARLVLVTPYDSIAAVAAARLWWLPARWLLRDRYESWRYASRLSTPTTLVIAGRDRVIPAASSWRLARAFAPGVARVVVIRDAGHNDVGDFPAYLPALVGHSPMADSRPPTGHDARS